MTEEHLEAQSIMAHAQPASHGEPLWVSYKVPLSLRLRYTITSTTHLTGIIQRQVQNHAASAEFLPIKNGRRVESYSESLRSLYIDPETVHLARNHWKVIEIKTYKDHDTTIKHEYLIATLSDGDGGEVLLQIDRRIHDSSMKMIAKSIIQQYLSSQGQPNPPSNSDPNTPDAPQPNDANANIFWKIAVDDIALVPNLPTSDKQKLVEHILFHDQNVLLPQLIMLACAINDYSNEYHIIETNCYWFCYLMAELLKRLSKPTFPLLVARGKEPGH